MLLLQPGREGEEVFQPSARHGDVLVELGETGVSQRVGEFAAKLPERFTTRLAIAALDKDRSQRANNSFQLLQFRTDGAFLAVEFDDYMSAAAGEEVAARPLLRRRQSEGVSHFQRAGQNARAENGADRPSGIPHGTKTNAETGAIRRQRQQLQRRLGNDSQEPFAANKQAMKIESGLVFVRAPAQPRD